MQADRNDSGIKQKWRASYQRQIIRNFMTRPISGTLLGITAIMTVAVCFKMVRMKRAMIEDEDD